MTTPEPDPSNKPRHPTRSERRDIEQNQGLSAVSVYGIIHRSGTEELSRPLMSLWWSGVAAGMGISSSVLAEGILHGIYEDHPYRAAIENLGYTVGFILVIMGRLQLFTENTLSAILPLLTHRKLHTLWATARLWSMILLANFAGTFLAMALGVWAGTLKPETLDSMLAISRHFGELSFSEALRYGIPSGFFIAAIVWMMPAAGSAGILVIFLFTYLIAIAEFTHVIAGSAELFLLLMSGDIGVAHALSVGSGALLGNILGGTGLFALMAYGQVAGEIKH